MQDLVLDSPDIGAFLEDFARNTAAAMSSPGSEIYCAVLLVRPRTRATMASNSPEVRMMDELQFRYDDGPCLRAARENTPCVVADLRTETRFGDYSMSILNTGIRSALGVPIDLESEAVAALDLYSAHPGEFDPTRVHEASRLAADASLALRTAVRIAHLTDTVKHLKAAMDSRATIQIAAGIIMGQNRCSHEAAMNILSSAASTRNTKLSDVAIAVLRSVGQVPPAAHFDS